MVLARNEYPNYDYYCWIDCVTSPNLPEIIEHEFKGCTLNLYGGKGTIKMCDVPFSSTNDFSPNGAGADIDQYCSGSVLKLHCDAVDEFVYCYSQFHRMVDNQFELYDEEIILSLMYEERPDLFSAVNI